MSVDIENHLHANRQRLSKANALTRELRHIGVLVQRIDIAMPVPRLFIDRAPDRVLPLCGVRRRRVDSELFECAAHLHDCEVVWAEVDA